MQAPGAPTGITGPGDCPSAYGGALPSLTPLAAAASAVPCVWVSFPHQCPAGHAPLRASWGCLCSALARAALGLAELPWAPFGVCRAGFLSVCLPCQASSISGLGAKGRWELSPPRCPWQGAKASATISAWKCREHTYFPGHGIQVLAGHRRSVFLPLPR